MYNGEPRLQLKLKDFSVPPKHNIIIIVWDFWQMKYNLQNSFRYERLLHRQKQVIFPMMPKRFAQITKFLKGLNIENTL